MAVSDPHMEEMCIIFYEPRQRACNWRQSITIRDDFIEVYNFASLPEMWCPAEVLHVASIPEQECIAQGVILY